MNEYYTVVAGRKNQIADKEILMRFVVSPEPVLVASEVAEEIDMTRQGTAARLEKLEDRGLIKSAKKASSRVWWITPEGREFLDS